jgi:Uma2 family endonuclease
MLSSPLLLQMPSSMTDEQFFEFCQLNRDLRIDRKNRHVYIYRPGEDVECLENPDVVNCEPILPGFVLKMGKIW